MFNVFKKKISSVNDQILDYSYSTDETAVWNNYVHTNLNSFFPVFNKSQIRSKYDLNIISNSFHLFKVIKRHNLINYPINLDLEKDLSLSFDFSSDFSNRLIMESIITEDKSMDDDLAADLEDEMNQLDVIQRINIKYPYSKSPHPYLNDIGLKRFNLQFKNRFVHNEIKDHEIILLPNEYYPKITSTILPNIHYHIINTNHNNHLFERLKNFKREWRNLELNKFIAPFPKYWFIFINKGLPKEWWINQFRNDYPSVADRPVMRKIEEIISDLHDLNWIECYLSKENNDYFVFPDLKGLRKKRLSSVFKVFKNYVFSLDSEIKFIQDISDTIKKNIILLDSFNVIDLCNKAQKITSQKNCKVVVPDFIYFCYQPWIRCHLLDYQSSVLLNSIRENLDVDFEINQSGVSSTKEELIKSIRLEIYDYNSQYKAKKEKISDNDIETIDQEDIEFMNEEEVDMESNQKRIQNNIIISTVEGEELYIMSNEFVLLQRDSFIKAPASSLTEGDLFLLNDDLNNLISDDNLYNKLAEIPESVKTYQSKLFNYPNVYRVLKTKGISYLGEGYFNSKYLLPLEKISDDTIIIPRRKNDWSIICDLLSINHNDMNLAFIAYYGRKKKNRIKEIYRSVIDLFLKNDYFGIVDNPLVIKQIENIVNRAHDVFNKDEYYESNEISTSIVTTIMNELKFKEIKELKIIRQ